MGIFGSKKPEAKPNEIYFYWRGSRQISDTEFAAISTLNNEHKVGLVLQIPDVLGLKENIKDLQKIKVETDPNALANILVSANIYKYRDKSFIEDSSNIINNMAKDLSRLNSINATEIVFTHPQRINENTMMTVTAFRWRTAYYFSAIAFFALLDLSIDDKHKTDFEVKGSVSQDDKIKLAERFIASSILSFLLSYDSRSKDAVYMYHQLRYFADYNKDGTVISDRTTFAYFGAEYLYDVERVLGYDNAPYKIINIEVSNVRRALELEYEIFINADLNVYLAYTNDIFDDYAKNKSDDVAGAAEASILKIQQMFRKDTWKYNNIMQLLIYKSINDITDITHDEHTTLEFLSSSTKNSPFAIGHFTANQITDMVIDAAGKIDKSILDKLLKCIEEQVYPMEDVKKLYKTFSLHLFSPYKESIDKFRKEFKLEDKINEPEREIRTENQGEIMAKQEKVGHTKEEEESLLKTAKEHEKKGDDLANIGLQIAEDHYEKAIKIAEDLGEKELIKSIKVKLIKLYETKGDKDTNNFGMPIAIDSYQKAIAEAQDLTEKDVVRSLNIKIVNVYEKCGDKAELMELPTAMDYYEKAVAYAEKIDEKEIAKSMNTKLIKSYTKRGDMMVRFRKIDAALNYYKQAKEAAQKYDDKVSEKELTDKINKLN